jgi:hypothetical protein
MTESPYANHVDIPHPIYRALQKKAAQEGRTIKELVLRGVEIELRTEVKKSLRRHLPTIHSDKPGSLKLDNAKIFEIIPFP